MGAVALGRRKRKEIQVSVVRPLPIFSVMADSAGLARPAWAFESPLGATEALQRSTLACHYPSLLGSTFAMEFKGSDRGPFVPALIVVDMQEDFCPPVSLAEIADHIAREARTC